jgi:hypothetical protein
MGPVELVATASSLSLLAGWRLYAAVFVAGLALRLGIIDAPASLDVLGNPWLLGVAAAGALAEFFADKIAWVDSAWDAVHSLLRPLGGALIAWGLVAPSDPAWQVAAMLLGGGAAFATHTAKAGARAALNASPEPVSNVVMSGVEDVTTAGALALAVTYPLAALGVIGALLAVMAAIVLAVRRFVRDARGAAGWFARRTKPRPPA